MVLYHPKNTSRCETTMETKPAPAAPSGGMETAVSTVPKIRDIGTIALEALGKIDTVLAFELSVMNDHMKAMEGENALIKAENDMLKAKLVQQKEDEADIYYYLHKKLDANYEVIAQLESDIQTVKLERDAMDKAFHIKQDETQDAFAKEKKELTERIESAEDTLHALEVFRERKIVLEDTIAAMESTLAAEKDNHKKVNKDTEVEMAKRTHFYQKLIKKLNERVQSDHVAARTHAALTQGQERTKTDVNKANEDMIALLQTKSNGLETQLRTLCAELADARTHVDEARAEKHAMLAQQDDTLRFLSVAIHDITHQLALSGHGHAAPSSLHAWQAGDVIPAKLDDLAPSDVKKVLQMLFGKLHAYQAAIVVQGILSSERLVLEIVAVGSCLNLLMAYPSGPLPSKRCLNG
ncbi:hypothetical protein B5M09_004967 [Aphanomyces astaci]|uniref:Cilia- and flagella-associated protein 157 n=1 Tax=Aphanomyces astaci TaxID=112090 RepID=A0A425D3F7_APHAT|nr:hypothetical protein B5M09_004967 [Aphanomyces astaci]